MKLTQQFNELTPRGKKAVIWATIGIVFLVLVATGYNSSRSDLDEKRYGREESKEIQLEPDLIQKTMLREQRRQLEALQKAVENIRLEQQKKAQEPIPANTENVLPEIPTAEQITQKAILPPTPKREQPHPIPPSSYPQIAPPVANQSQTIGEISVLSNPVAEDNESLPMEDKKKGRSVYLPPSFMEAKLLTGFDASTSGKGTNNPEPLLLRIQTPAVLPNDIKANLSGCFVIAEAVGRLDKERADVRLVSLSCLSNAGKAVIDTQVKGFITDSDSKVGLSGRVVSKMGAATARTIMAGFFGGMGDMLKAASTTQSTSALGTTTSIESDQVAKYSIGGGLSEGSASLHDFYLNLAKQATPVIEVGAAKEITVVISEGQEIEIKELEGEEF